MVPYALFILSFLIAFSFPWCFCAYVYWHSAGTMAGLWRFIWRCHGLALPFAAVFEAMVVAYVYAMGHFDGLNWQTIALGFGGVFPFFAMFVALFIGMYSAGFRRWPFDCIPQKQSPNAKTSPQENHPTNGKN